jgi:hypothetical protein
MRRRCDARASSNVRSGWQRGPARCSPSAAVAAARVFGLLAVWQNRGLALVYGAALAGWAYLFAWGGLKALHAGSARELGALIGILFGLAVIVDVEWTDRRN